MAKATLETPITEESGNGGSEEKKKYQPNPWAKKLRPEMINNPFPLDFLDGMDSREYALEKLRRDVIVALEFKSLKEWMDFAKQLWAWNEDNSMRVKDEKSDSVVSEAKDDPVMLRLLKEKLEPYFETLS